MLRNVTVRDDVASAALAVGATISDGDYYVSVSNDGFGDVAFVSDTNQNPAGAMPLFTFRDNLESVLILDHSSQEMHITGIDVIYRGTDVPLVQFIRRSLSSTVVAQGTTTMQFDLWRNLTPEGGSVDVQKIQRDGDVRRSDADIVVDGSIINPIGWTRILTTDGDIRSGSNSAWIETNVADLEATRGSVGDAAAARLHVRLVQSINRGDRPATSDDTLRTVRLFVTAGVDTYLYLQAADRVNPTSSPLPTTALPVGIDAVVAGRHADLVLADSVRQEGTSLVAETRVRVDKEPHDQNYSSHFRPDGADSYRDPAAYLGTDSVSIDSTWTFERTASLAVRVLGTHPLTGLAAFGLNRTLTAFPTAGTPGLTAGTPGADGNIIVADVQGDANWTTSGSAGLATPVTTLVGFTDVTGLGHLDTSVDGDVTLTEVAGDLRAGMIRSRGGDVLLTSRLGGIVDAPTGADAAASAGDFGADVVGVNVTLFSPLGGVGGTTNFLEIDSSNADGTLLNGVVTIDALASIYLTEVDGLAASVDDLRLDTVISRTGDVTLTTRAGSILDARNGGAGDDAWNIQGRSIDLDANGGSIGDALGLNDLEIDSSVSGPFASNDVGLEASGSIFVTETDSYLRLVLAHAESGNIRLTVRETAAATDEDLYLIQAGSVRFSESGPDSPRNVPHGMIFADGVAPAVGERAAARRRRHRHPRQQRDLGDGHHRHLRRLDEPGSELRLDDGLPRRHHRRLPGRRLEQPAVPDQHLG